MMFAMVVVMVFCGVMFLVSLALAADGDDV